MFSIKLIPSDVVDDLRDKLNDKYLYAGAWNYLYTNKQEDYMRFRKRLKDDLYKKQEECCAYCECRTDEGDMQIEHFAPKGGEKNSKYVEQQFNPLNLVLSCKECNEKYKKTFDPVVSNVGDYRNWKFKILHPYFDDPTEYFSLIQLTDGLKGFFPIIKSDADFDHKEKAKETIMLFKFYEEERIIKIAKSFIGKLYYPEIEHILIQKANEYKIQLDSIQKSHQKELIAAATTYRRHYE